MNKFIPALLAVFTLAAVHGTEGELDVLRGIFQRENTEAEKRLQDAETTMELTGAAGHCRQIAEKQLRQVLDCKLRHTGNREKRWKMLENYAMLNREAGKLISYPRKELGSLAGMRISLAITRLIRQQTEILMLSGPSEQLWVRIADAPLVIDGREIHLNQGKAEFEDIRYGQKTILKILLFPKDTFTRQKRDFALIRTDIPFPVGSTFSRSYLCELKNGRHVILRE